MSRGLTRDEEIKMIIGRVINISDICTLIIQWVNKIERKETLDYHNELWERIAGSYFKSISERYPTYSYICSILFEMPNIL